MSRCPLAPISPEPHPGRVSARRPPAIDDRRRRVAGPPIGFPPSPPPSFFHGDLQLDPLGTIGGASCGRSGRPCGCCCPRPRPSASSSGERARLASGSLPARRRLRFCSIAAGSDYSRCARRGGWVGPCRFRYKPPPFCSSVKLKLDRRMRVAWTSWTSSNSTTFLRCGPRTDDGTDWASRPRRLVRREYMVLLDRRQGPGQGAGRSRWLPEMRVR